MSVTGITSNLFNLSPPNLQDPFKQFQQSFQQLGQDLRTGNLSAAQSDLTNLQKLQPLSTNTSSTTGRTRRCGPCGRFSRLARLGLRHRPTHSRGRRLPGSRFIGSG